MSCGCQNKSGDFKKKLSKKKSTSSKAATSVKNTSSDNPVRDATSLIPPTDKKRKGRKKKKNLIELDFKDGCNFKSDPRFKLFAKPKDELNQSELKDRDSLLQIIKKCKEKNVL